MIDFTLPCLPIFGIVGLGRIGVMHRPVIRRSTNDMAPASNRSTKAEKHPTRVFKNLERAAAV